MVAMVQAAVAPAKACLQRRKSEQLVLRIAPDQKAILEQAALVSGRTVTDIVTEGARIKALDLIREEQELATWQLSRRDATVFVESLLGDREPSARMVSDYEAYVTSRASRFTTAETANSPSS
jgi:uncharacterized protein (DUF1778 family)